MTVKCYGWAMEEKKRYSIEELAQVTGVTRRTVYFYVQRGLIPRPLGVGRGKHYTDEHVESLLRIQALKREGLGLDQIVADMRGEPVEVSEDFERDLVTRIKLAEGIFLEIGHGVRIPPLRALREMQRIIKQTTSFPRRTL